MILNVVQDSPNKLLQRPRGYAGRSAPCYPALPNYGRNTIGGDPDVVIDC